MTKKFNPIINKKILTPTIIELRDIHEFVTARFSEIHSMQDLIHFHTINKYLFMSFSPPLLHSLGRIVANSEKIELNTLLSVYENDLNKILNYMPTTKSHSNTLYHILGHFSNNLNSNEKSAIITLIDSYKDNSCTLSTVLSILKEFTIKFDKTYLVRQTYFLLYLNTCSTF